MVLESCHSPSDFLQMELKSVSSSFCTSPLMPKPFLIPMLTLWTKFLGRAEGDPIYLTMQKKEILSALRFECI